jgi:uncharacterized membrane protein
MSQTKIHIKRHIAKAISYRIVGSLTTFILTYIFTGSLVISSSISFIEIIIKPLNYFLHERIWYKWIKFGVLNESKKEEVKKIETTETKKTLNYTSNR